MLATHADDIEILHQLGLLLARNRRFREAAEVFERILEQNHQHKQSYNNLGNIAVEYGNLDAAEEMYREAIEIDPNYRVAIENLAGVYRRKGDVRRHISTLRRSGRTAWRSLSPFRRSKPSAPETET